MKKHIKLLIVILVVTIGIGVGVCNAKERFYVSPNPATQKDTEVKFHFNYSEPVEWVEISIYDLSCRVITTQQFRPGRPAGALPLHIGDLKGGLYIWHAEVLLRPGIKKEYVKLLGVIR